MPSTSNPVRTVPEETPGWLCVVSTPPASPRPFTAAFVVAEASGLVEASAPILKWTRGKRGREVVEALRARGDTVTIMPRARLRERAADSPLAAPETVQDTGGTITVGDKR